MIEYKSILVHVEPSPTSDQRLSCAVQLADRLGAVLIGVGGTLPLYLASPWCGSVDGDLMQVVRDDDIATLAQSKARFFERAQALAGKAEWREKDENPAKSLIAYAAGADLIVASLRTRDQAMSPSAADLIVRSGIPVLAVPEGLSDISAKTVVVLWKDAPETRRAVTDALPLLLRAQSVTILEIVETGQGDYSVARDVVDRLSRHGVNCRVQTILQGRQSVASEVFDVVDSGLVDLVVSGAFGHSRAQEWVFGGVTQTLLARAACPVLFSH